jgi:arginase family enzyme
MNPPGASIPNCQPGLWPEGISPSRLASRIATKPDGCEIALIGLADDLGVGLNSGRPGARQGPAAFRAALSRYGVAEPQGWDWPSVFDAGDIVPAEGDAEAALHATHKRVTEAVSAVLDLGLFPIAVGGGHDLTFPFVRALANRNRGLRGIYFDAHLDVRETAGSGMPFRKLIEECGVAGLQVFGASPFANSSQHWDWFTSHGGHIGSAADLEGGGSPPLPRPCFVSMDLDVLDSAYAPGVSAINPSGLAPPLLERAAQAAGRADGVLCFDIMELNPQFDVDGRTARIAAHLFLSFLRGFAARSHRRKSS